MINDVGRWVLEEPAARGRGGTPQVYHRCLVNVWARQLKTE